MNRSYPLPCAVGDCAHPSGPDMLCDVHRPEYAPPPPDAAPEPPFTDDVDPACPSRRMENTDVND